MNSRRTFLKAAAWAAPTAIVATTAPAFASSSRPSVAGLLCIKNNCKQVARGRYEGRIQLTTRGTRYGFRVENSEQEPTSAKIELFLKGVKENATWRGDTGGWSRPTFVRTEDGFTVWEMVYDGPWRREGDTWHTNEFNLESANLAYWRSQKEKVRAIRTAEVGGREYSIDSGYIYG